MPKRVILLSLVVILCTSACVLGGTETAATADVSDPDVLDRLGIAEPGPVQWQRSGDGVEIVGTTQNANPAELALLEAALAEIPDPVRDQIIVRFIVRSRDATDRDLHPATAAFPRGPDVYLIDRTFQEQGAGASRLGLARVLVHEMGHVAQFETLDVDYVDRILDGSITNTDTGDGSTLVRDFAIFVGWQDGGTDKFEPRWSLPDAPSGTTEYGATAPDEDMAEALAMVVLGRAGLLSPERVEWVEAWLGVDARDFGNGKPWVPPGSVEVFFSEPLYDEAAVAQLRRRHTEPMYWQLTDDMPLADQLADRVSAELRNRGLTGLLEAVSDPRLPRFSGRFLRADGASFWVELWDFRESSGFRAAPERPVLTYVMEW